MTCWPLSMVRARRCFLIPMLAARLTGWGRTRSVRSRCIARMRRRTRRHAIVVVLLGGLAAGTSLAHACTIDGKPSAVANRTRAIIFRGAPTAATYASWARFAFPGAFRVGQRIAFHEDDALVRSVLTQADLRHAWRWRFGDGAAQTGDRVAHTYRRAGRYKVAVDASYPAGLPRVVSGRQHDHHQCAVGRTALDHR